MVSMAVVIAIGVRSSGEREVLGVDVGASEDGAFWLQFLRGLVARGLDGIQLVISDAHEGLKGAIAAALHGAAWQRCRVHFVRNALAPVPKSAQQLVAATIRTVFAQPDAASTREQWRRVADNLRPRFPKVANLLDAAEGDVLAYLDFPAGSSTRISRIALAPKAVIRLVGAVLAEQHDEWQVGKRYLSAESLALLSSPTPALPALLAAD